MAISEKFLRYASPNERRAISREDLGLYYAVIIGAVYEFGPSFKIDVLQSYVAALRQVIDEHPFLSAVVADAHTDKAYYERVPSIDAENHITILPTLHEGQDESAVMTEILAKDLDRPFRTGIPPWRIHVLPLTTSQAWIIFSFSHSMGDGPSGTAFHRSFLKALQNCPKEEVSASPSSGVIATPNQQLGLPYDTPERLPISWSFLLGPLLGAILPKFLANLFGLRATVAVSSDEGTWLGTRVASFNPDTHRTKLKLREIEAPVLASVILTARAHEARLTGTLLQLITRALAKALPDPTGVTNFISQTAVNMRGSVGTPADEMGEFASGSYVRHPVPANPAAPLDEDEWAAARDTTRQLAEAASKLQDQPIGLLRYAPSVRKWMSDKIGSERDASIEMSNLGAFAADGGEGARITKMVFAQPGHVVGPPISLNVVSVKGGNLTYTMTWPTGAMGMPEEDEEGFMSQVCDFLDAEMVALGAL